MHQNSAKLRLQQKCVLVWVHGRPITLFRQKRLPFASLQVAWFFDAKRMSNLE